MTTKKIQNFVKNIGTTPSNKTLQFSKLKKQTDLHEDLFAFENLESDKEEAESVEESLINNEISKNNDDVDDTLNICDNETKIFDDCEMNNFDQDVKSTGLRKGLIGKSVNTAFKDAHSAINAMKESIKKKAIRKPSEVAKDPKGGFKRRKAAMAAMLREYRAFSSEKPSVCELQIEVEEPPDCSVNEVIQESPEVDVTINDSPRVSLSENFETESDGITENIVNNTVEHSIIEYNMETNVATQSLNSFSDLKIYVAVGIFLLLFFMFAISKFILGLLCGIIMSFGGMKIYESLFETVDDVPTVNKQYPRLRDLMSPVIPHYDEDDFVDEYSSPKSSYSAWVNAVNTYHPSLYNVSASYSLHISLEGTLLRMRKPKNKLSSRVMSTNLKISGVTIIGESNLELLHAKIHLLPYGLVRRRMWSKRYPICITVKKSIEDKSSRTGISTNKPSDSFSLVPHSDEENFYFFARTCREKEEMFRRLMAASLGMPITMTVTDIVEKYLSKEMFMPQPVPLMHVHDIVDSDKDGSVMATQRGLPRNVFSSKEPQLVTYVRYMAKFMPSESLLTKAKSHQIDLNYISCESELLWLNALVGRLAWEVFRGGHWVKIIREKIQRKLKRLHLPYFIDQLAIVDIDLGTELPVVRKVSRPYLDYRGLWVEFEMEYAGGFSMGLETKINLLKLKKVANQQKISNKTKKCEFSAKYNVDMDCSQLDNSNNNINDADSDNVSNDVSMDTRLQINMSTGGGAVVAEEDDGDGSAMLSTDESYASTSDSELPDDNAQGLPQTSSNKSLLQWVDKITKSSYFLKATDNKYVMKTMEYVSNTSLQLQVDTHYLNGTLAINIPPPPSDRLWWGFKNSPQLNIKARPKVGQTEIQMTKLVEFIEKKLLQEFHRALVLPNMDDISIPLLFNGNPEKYSQTLF